MVEAQPTPASHGELRERIAELEQCVSDARKFDAAVVRALDAAGVGDIDDSGCAINAVERLRRLSSQLAAANADLERVKKPEDWPAGWSWQQEAARLKAKCDEQTERTCEIKAHRDKLLAAIKEHHDQKADDRCIEDDTRLYAAAGLEPADHHVGDKNAMLENCKRFIEKRCLPGKWKNYTELEQELALERSAHEQTKHQLDLMTDRHGKVEEPERDLRLEKTRHEATAEELRATHKRLASLQEELGTADAVLRRNDYWRWQGDGTDHPESLVAACRVVMTAEQLRGLLQEKAQLAAKLACADAAGMTFGLLKEAGKPERWSYDFRPESPLGVEMKKCDEALVRNIELEQENRQLAERLRESEAIIASVLNREFIAKTLHNLTGGPQDESWEEANGSERAWPYRIADGLFKKLTKSKSDAARTVASH